MKIFIDFRRWFQILLVGVLFLSLVSFAPAVPPIQDETQGYWALFDEDTAHNWIRDNYRGLKARYTPFFPSDYSIGATYEERNIQFKKDVEPGIFITEQATCSLSGYDLEKHKLLNPGDAIPLTLGVQASMVGPGTVKDVHKASLRFRNFDDNSTNQNILYVESFQEKTTTADIVDDAPKTKSGKWLVPVGKKAGEVRVLEMSCFVAGGIVKVYKYFKYRWVIQETESDVENNPPVAPPKEPSVQITGTTVTKCQLPYNGTPQQKLQEILNRYYKKIKVGVYSSGAKNNAMSVLPGYGHLAVFRCGGYQGEVLKLLEEIKFDTDPCVAGLLDDYDFGPIQAWFGGHQAVVIYPTGKDWLSAGLVLDPWMNQKPEVYTIQKWAKMWSQFKSYGGIGPSNVYAPNYPTHGGRYVNPKGTKLTPEQQKYIKNLPKNVRDKYDKMESTDQLEFLRRHADDIQKGNKFMVQSPLAVYVMDDEGRKSGMVNGSLTREIPEVYFSAFPLQDGTVMSQLEYPPDKLYKLILVGTGDGAAHVFSSYRATADEFADPQSFVYTYSATKETEYMREMEPGSPLTGPQGPIKGRVLDASAETMIKSLPDIQSPEPYSIKPEKVTDVSTEETGDGGLILGVGAGIACLCVITLGIVLVIVLILFLKKKSPANPQVG
jgi:hypothetical protein